MSVLPLSDALPETNLPGFARAFLSFTFQWLEEDKIEKIDWETKLPEEEWGTTVRSFNDAVAETIIIIKG